MTFSIVADPSVDASLWDAYANASPGSSLYHLHGWKDVIEKTFGHRTIYLAARADATRLVGILPLAELKSPLFGRMLVSLPFFNYGGVCADDESIRDALLDAAVDVAKEGKASFLEVRQEEDWTLDLPRKTSKVSMRLPLPESLEALWKGLGAKLRNQVQKPRKEGLTAVVGREELLDDFYQVFAVNMRDLGTPVYPAAFFRNILGRFPDRTWIAAVYKDRVPLAAGFLAGFKDRLEIPWASSLREYNRLSPNMLLYWTCLEFACAKGYDSFDFGRSTVGESTYRFKEQWGARPHQLYWYYWMRNGGSIPQVNPANPKYRAAIAAWQRMPVGLTRWIGPKIVKYIP